MSSRLFVVGSLALAMSIAGGCEKEAPEGGATPTSSAADRCPHDIKKDKCPFCTPALIESDGFCGEHGVAEALCAQCRPYLKAVFRTQGDWCEVHNMPDSQCVTCNPELKDKIRPGEHGGAQPTEGTPSGGEG